MKPHAFRIFLLSKLPHLIKGNLLDVDILEGMSYNGR